MTRFLARRLLNYVVLLFVASFLTFSLTSLTFAPLDSLLQRNPRPPQSAIDAKAAELDLDKPIPLRYVAWASDAVRGDFGTTVAGQPVSDELWRRIGVSLRLVLIGSLLGTVVGVVVGAWGAIRQYKLSDRVITVTSLLVISTPTFVIANLLILAALNVNSALGIQLFEYTGETSATAGTGTWSQFVDRLQHLVLPTLTLALASIAGFSRYQRNAMLDVLGQDFIRTARAKGLTRREALFKHGLRTALIPMATLFAYGVSGLVTGAVFTEKIFGWHGMGEWVVQGIATQDTNIIAAITVFSGATILLAGLLSDVIYAALDPRVRGDVTEPVTTDSSSTAKSGVDVAAFASRRTLVLRRFLRNRPAVASLAILVLMFVGCYALPPLLPWSYTGLDYLSLQQPPSPSHWFGTNGLGQDLFAQAMRGMQKSLLIGVCVAFISTIIAATVGSIAGYFGGWRDRTSMWVVDLLLVVPSFILIAIVTPQTRKSGTIFWLILLLAAFSWMISSRIVRGLTMSLREREFVTAARYMGVSNWRIIVRHVLPNVASILIVDTALNVGIAILAETGLSFLGFGIQPPDVSLGTLIADGTNSVTTFPWVFLFPAGILVLIVLCSNLVGDGLRDALDPSSKPAKSKRRRT